MSSIYTSPYKHLTSLPVKSEMTQTYEQQQFIINSFNDLFESEYKKFIKSNNDINVVESVTNIINQNTIIFSNTITLFNVFELKLISGKMIVKCLSPLNKTLLSLSSMIYNNYSEIKSLLNDWLNIYQKINVASTVPLQKLFSIRNYILTTDLQTYKLDFNTDVLKNDMLNDFKALGINPENVNLYITVSSNIYDNNSVFQLCYEYKDKFEIVCEHSIEKNKLSEFLTNLYVYGKF